MSSDTTIEAGQEEETMASEPMSQSESLKPCPFCGGEPERLELTDEDNFGGGVISCKKCGASSPVHFDRKENLDDSWNRRTSTADRGGEVEVKALEWRENHGVAHLGPYRLFEADTPLGRFAYGTDAEGSCYWHSTRSGVFMAGSEEAAQRMAEASWAKMALAEAGKFIDARIRRFENGAFRSSAKGESAASFLAPGVIAAPMRKGDAGRLLDGVEHSAFPISPKTQGEPA